MQIPGDRDDDRAAWEEAGVILVGLSFTDRDLGRRIAAMIATMAECEMVDLDEADLVLTDRAGRQAGPKLIVSDRSTASVAGSTIGRDASATVLRAAIHLVVCGYRVTRPVDSQPSHRADDDTDSFGEPPTAREREVLQQLAAGASNKMIARDLGISVATAKFHVGTLLAKLGARNRTDAVAIALRRGLLLV